MAYKVNQSRATVVCLDDGGKVDTFAQLVGEGKVPHVQAVVAWAAEETVERNTAFKKVGVTFLTWTALIERGNGIADNEMDKLQGLIRPGHCCGLIYTSGTTGPPRLS